MTGTLSAGVVAPTGAVRELAEGLRRELGPDLRTDLGTRALYASDASNYRVVPAMVAFPPSVEGLAMVVARTAEVGVPITMRGAGTSVAGNAIGPGVVIDTSRHLRGITAIDPDSATATVEPGVVLDDLNRHAKPYGLRAGPDPSTHNRCTVGGMIGNNACGAHSVRWGTTAANTVSLDVIRADGTLMRVGPAVSGRGGSGQPLDPRLERSLRAFVGSSRDLLRRELPPWPRRVSGYALDWLLPERGFDVAKALVGTEGSCVVVAAATLQLVRPPATRSLLVLGFPDDVTAASVVPALLGQDPLTIEGMTVDLLPGREGDPAIDLLPVGSAWLLVEVGGADRGAAVEHATRLADAAGRRLEHRDVRLHVGGDVQAALWRIREEGAGRATRLADGSPAWPGLEDAAVPPDRLARYLSDFRALMSEHDLRGTTYGHFGEGCIHVRIGFRFERSGAVEQFSRFMSSAADLIISHGGTLSGEHGDGRARGALLAKQFSPELLERFARFRTLWDPSGTLNPGVIIDPQSIEVGLRPPLPTLIPLEPSFAYRSDRGDFRSAVARCVGVGKCIARTTDGLMCPSYRATGDERHSTRGRARLLQEMAAGSLAPDGWRSPDVRDALDLCLACRGCLTECPTGVDMATYKSEFLAHHYGGRIRPRVHYSLGWLPYWLRLAQPIARPVSRLMRVPPLARAFALVAGIEPDLGLPPFAAPSFAKAYRPRAPRRQARGRVVLWPDTFNNFLTPGVAIAASRVLAEAGFEVVVPRSPVCCGLTWTTTGQLDQARRVLRQTLRAKTLAGEEPVVVLEPSCAAMLRRDMPDLMPDDARAAAFARRVTTFAELLDSVGFELPDQPRKTAVAQPHCHQQAVLGNSADRAVLDRCGIDAESVTGCCGLAGSFGSERGHGAVSRAVAELALLPALERAGTDELVLADGFSCRTQIAHLAGRRALHLAEVLADRLPQSEPDQRPCDRPDGRPAHRELGHDEGSLHGSP